MPAQPSRHIRNIEEFPTARKVLIIPQTKSSPNLCTELEIAAHLQDLGADVDCLLLKNAALAMRWKEGESLFWFSKFRRRVMSYFKHLDGVNILEKKLPPAKDGPTPDRTNLKALYHENLDLGYALLSSLTKRYHDMRITSVTDRELKHLSDAVVAVYEDVRQLIREKDYDLVVVFNGRFAPGKAAIRAAEREGIDFITYERSYRHERYTAFLNCAVHDRKEFREAANLQWDETPEEDRLSIGRNFYLIRRRGYDAGGAIRTYTRVQAENLLPEGFDSTAFNVALFTSTNHETASLSEEWDEALFDEQYELAAYLAANLEREAIIWIRRHPNEANFQDLDRQHWERLERSHQNVKVIPASSPVSTYALLDHSDIVITRCSTVAPEAVFAGRPAIVTGAAWYRGMGVCLEPNTRQELLSIIEKFPKGQSASEGNREGAIKYGFYWDAMGIPFVKFVSLNKNISKTASAERLFE